MRFISAGSLMGAHGTRCLGGHAREHRKLREPPVLPFGEDDGVRTPLTYYGGKQLLAAEIVKLMPPHRVYLEPFAGGAAVLFHKPRCERETLNDLDSQIVRFWRALRERPDELATAVAATPYSREEWRRSREPAEDDVEAARRLLVNIDQSFSRSRGSWSVPCIGDGRGRWQPGTWANLPPKLLACIERLSGVALEHGDAVDMIARWDRPDAVIYCDPPYEGPGRIEPRKGYAIERAGLWDDLVDALLEVRHAAVLVSGYRCQAQGHPRDALAQQGRPVTLPIRHVSAREIKLLPGADELSVHFPYRGRRAGDLCRIAGTFWDRAKAGPHAARVKLANGRRKPEPDLETTADA